MVRTALVIQGGGVWIFLMFGIIQRLMLDLGRRYDAIVGTSSGSILALSLAPGTPEAVHETGALLGGVRGNRDIYTGGGGFRALLWALGRMAGLHDPAPVYRMLRARWDRVRAREVVELRAIAVSLTTGRVRAFSEQDGHLFPRGVLASSSVYPYFPAVEHKGDLLVDGGVKASTAIGQALDMGATRIDVVLSHPPQVTPWAGPSRGFAPLERELGLLQHEVARGDLVQAHLRNELARAGKPAKEGDRAARIEVCHPDPGDVRDLHPASYLDFESGLHARMIRAGRAESRLQSLAAAVAMAGEE